MDETTYTGPTGSIEDDLAAYTHELLAALDSRGAVCDNYLPERGTEKQGLD